MGSTNFERSRLGRGRPWGAACYGTYVQAFNPVTNSDALSCDRVSLPGGDRRGKGCRLCLLSAKSTRRKPDSAVPDLLCGVSKQQVAAVDAEGHLHAPVRWSEHVLLFQVS
jgi:hypothetical protein